MNSTNQQQTAKGIIKTLTILHYAYCAALLIFGCVAIYITKNAAINFADTEDLFFYFVPVFAIALALLSHFLFQINLKKVRQKESLKDKLVHYQSTRIIRYAMLEAPALFSVVVFIMTSNQYYLIISVVLLAYLVLLRPSKTVIKQDLDLSAEQDREFRKAID